MNLGMTEWQNKKAAKSRVDKQKRRKVYVQINQPGASPSFGIEGLPIESVHVAEFRIVIPFVLLPEF